MKNVCIIPARGGSKGIVKKNLKEIAGKPLLQWTIEQAMEAKKIDETWVTSDCDEILSLAESCGAFCIKRPPELSTDSSTSESAWIHAVEHIQQRTPINIVIAPQPTSPIREPSDFDGAIDYLIRNGLDSLFSSNVYLDHYLWGKSKDSKFYSINYDYTKRGRRQNANIQYLENGSFYIFYPKDLITHNNRLSGKIGAYEMAFWKSFQIDEMEDIKFCESIMKSYLL